MEVRDIAQWKKKKESSISHAAKKSKHKHDYHPCIVKYTYLFINSEHTYHMLADQCSICGKVANEHTLTEPYLLEGRGKVFRQLTDEELLAAYPDLPILERAL